jgi:hypothetical protein
MSPSRKLLCTLYGAIAAIALVGTWKQNLAYLGGGASFVSANVRFWSDTLVNPAARSITVDIFFFAMAATIFMVREARRLEIRGVWLYVVFGLLVAISVTFPLFLIARERRAASRGEGDTLRLRPADVAGLVLFAAAPLAITFWTLTR